MIDSLARESARFDDTVLLPVLAAFGFLPGCNIASLQGGLINQTFLVEQTGRRAVLQRLHPVFGADVQLDIEAITAHLERQGMLTPRLLRTLAGELWTHDGEGRVWRMLSFIPGRTLARIDRLEIARSAAGLVARFHRAVSDLSHVFHFTRPGAHDTAAHLQKLERALVEHAGHRNFAAVAPVAEAILRQAERLPGLPVLPQRIAHGDLKISNVLFAESGDRALALLDLDTLAHLTIAFELGDAFRSWCNPAGEDETRATFRVDVFEAALDGYVANARGLLTNEEQSSLIPGTQTIALELAARFCADALYESYFGWNADKFSSRGEHNLARAKSQLALSVSVCDQRLELEHIVTRAFSP
jgi:Ser/Thr protein kinase RdoA (MazF antagonist)